MCFCIYFLDVKLEKNEKNMKEEKKIYFTINNKNYERRR